MRKLFVMLVIALMVLTACSSQAPESQNPVPAKPSAPAPQVPAHEPEPTPSSMMHEQMPTSPMMNNQVREIMVKAFQFGFEPSRIEVKKGERIKLTGYSADVPHSIKIPGYNIDLRLDNQEKKSVEFVADKVGTFTFFCSVPCGEGHQSMKGTLVVSE